MADSEDQTKGFKVTDRRKFTADGDPRPHEGTERSRPTAASPEAGSAGSREPAAQQEPGGAPGEAGPGPPPEVRFVDLVDMLARNAFVQLGDLPEPVSGERLENLQGAQFMIGFLDMLREKTKGNLSKDEEDLLEEILYNLRMRFMTKANLIKS